MGHRRTEISDKYSPKGIIEDIDLLLFINE